MIILIQALICAYLWRLSGKGGFKGARYIRYIGVPLVMLLSMKLCWITALVLGLHIGGMFLSGYGVNSPIRAFFRWLFRNDGKCTQFATRLVNGLLWTFSGYIVGISIPYILIQSVLIAVVGAFIDKDVISEGVTGFIIGVQ